MITLLSFLFVLGVLIFVHELGHFLVARWYGVRVVTFSLGFGPKLFKYQRPGGTEYCISALPLGGYVKLAGESLEDERTGAPDEFMSKSKWIRIQVYLAGPTMNLLLAWALLAAVLSRGADVPLYETSSVVVGTVAADSPAAHAGIQPGDRIVRVDGRAVATWDDFSEAISPMAGRDLTVELIRHDAPIDLHVTPRAVEVMKFDIGDLGIAPVYRPQVQTVVPAGAAAKAGIERGDVILSVAGETHLDRDKIIAKIQKSAGSSIPFVIERGGREMTVAVTPELQGGVGRIGAEISGLEVRRIEPGWLNAARLSITQNWDRASLIGRTLRGLVTAKTPVKQLMGPVAIAQLSGEAASLGWLSLLDVMAMISLNLGLLNLMPVPVLDGGQITILALEGAARRDLSARVKERILLVGVALIALLMVTAIYNDVMRIIK